MAQTSNNSPLVITMAGLLKVSQEQLAPHSREWSELQRDVLDQRFVQGLSLGTIADHLGYKAVQVEAIMRRALNYMSKRLGIPAEPQTEENKEYWRQKIARLKQIGGDKKDK